MDDKTDRTAGKPSLQIAPAPEAKSGTTTSAGAGKAEAGLLMVGAMRNAAATIVDAVLAALGDGASAEILLMTGAETIDLTPLDRFEMIAGQLADGLKLALAEPEPSAGDRGMGDRGMGERGMGDRGMGDRGFAEAPIAGAIASVIPGVNIAGALLGAAATAAQYFAVKTSFAGVEISADNAMFGRELAARFLARRAGCQVRLVPFQDRDASAAVFGQLQTLGELAGQASAVANRIDTQIAATGDGAAKAALAARAAQLRAAAKAGADFLAALTTADAGGAMPVTAIAALRGVRDALDRGAAVLQVSLPLAGAGQFSRQGLFRGIFRDPANEIFAMVVAGYAVLVGRSLSLVAAGNVRSPTRYVAAREVADATDDTGAPHRA